MPVTVPPQPPAKMDYEVEFKAMRVQGDDFFVGEGAVVDADFVNEAWEEVAGAGGP